MKMDKKLYVNGRIFTSDESNLHADSMLVEDGIIKWVGNRENCPDRTCSEIIDLMDKCVLPGFVDAHMHIGMMAGQIRQISCLPPEINSIEELIDEIKNTAFEITSDGWIEGWGYDENKFTEKRQLNRYDLDKGAADVPVSITRTCGHIKCVNSKALELAGINRYTPDPEGGEIERDDNGEPTGILRENARDLISSVIPPVSPDEIVQNIIRTGEVLASQGVTSATDMGSLEGEDLYNSFRCAAANGLKQDIALYYIWDYFADNNRLQINDVLIDRDAQIRIAGLKLLGDGSISGRTAWMDRPYKNSKNEYGMPVCSEELIDSAIAFCKEKSLQLSMHAMGKRAIDRIIRRIKNEKPWTEEGVPFLRVEHITDPSEEAIGIASERGIMFVTQPNFLYAEIEAYIRNLGHEWLRKTYPVKSMLEQGVKIALSTDAPATSWATPSDPLPSIKCAVIRTAYDGTDCGQGEKIDLETAIILYTRNGAEAAGFKNTGQLKAGYNADFIVLDRDIFEMSADEIDLIKVEKTFKKGNCIFEIKK